MRYLLTLIAFLGYFFSHSQGEMLDFDSFDGGDNEITNAKNIKKIKGKSVLIVPFNYDLYNNQESEKMAEASDMEYEQMINYMRLSLDSAIVKSLKDSIKVTSLLSNYTAGVTSDIEYVHGHSIYYMMNKPLPVESDEKYSLFANKKNTSTESPLNGTIQKGDIVSKVEDNSKKFLNVKFDDINLINNITTKHQTRYILFITEFDLYGSYSNAYPKVGGNFSRVIRVHYSIYENTGEFVYGDFALAAFPSIENNVPTVCSAYFPEIADKIVKKLP